jgi:O-antigen ligase
MTLWGGSVSRVLIAGVLVLIWLSPFSIGPTPSFIPWLVSAIGAVLVWLFRPWLTVTKVANAWLLAALISACIGLLQYFGLTQALTPWVNTTALGEAFANLRQRNQFATLTSIGLLALLWQVAQQPTITGKNPQTDRRTLLYTGIGALLLALGNAASGSRTGLLQWVLVLGLTLMWAPRSQWRAVVVSAFALAAYVLSALALPWLLEGVAGVQSGGLLGRFKEEAGCGSRRVLWSNVLHLIAEKPWTGWGWGELDYAHFITLYPGERFCEILDNAHNLPLHLAVELGVPVALAVCGLGLWLTWRAKPWCEMDATRQLAWGVLAVILLHSMLEYPLWYGPFQIAVGLCVWLLWRKPFSPLAPVHSAWIATLFIAVIAYAGWDYWRISQIYLIPTMRAEAYRENTLNKIRGSWLFQNQVQFADLTTTTLTPENAAQINAMAHQLLHFSPEARVVEKLIDSAVMLGRDEEALYYLQRFKAAFPEAHARWSKK